MDLAQELYIRGLITYPRTETRKYEHCEALDRSLAFIATHDPEDERRRLAQQVQDRRFEPRDDGRSVGDHDPIIPVHCDAMVIGRRPVQNVIWDLWQEPRQRADRVQGGGRRDSIERREGASQPWSDEDQANWSFARRAASLYDLIVRHFLATMSPDCTVEQTVVSLELPSVRNTFVAIGSRTRSFGWIDVMRPCVDHAPDQPLDGDIVSALQYGAKLEILDVEVERPETKRPSRMTEAEHLRCMESHGIGTDATMPEHQFKLQTRQYMVVRDVGGRRSVYPTNIGKAFIHWLAYVNKDLISPRIRADVEAAWRDIAAGTRKKAETLTQFINQYRSFFSQVFLRGNRDILDLLIHFIKLANSGPEACRADVRWHEAEKRIKSLSLKDVASTVAARGPRFGSASAPADFYPRECLVNGIVLGIDGEDLEAAGLSVGQEVKTVFPQDGRLVVGFTTVRTLTTFSRRNRDIAFLSFGDGQHPGQVAMTAAHSVLASVGTASSTASGLRLWGPQQARELRVPNALAFLPASGRNPTHLALRSDPVVDTRDVEQVAEIELDVPHVALWLKVAGAAMQGCYPAGYVGTYGETVPDICYDSPRQTHVRVYNIRRTTPAYADTLHTHHLLQQCRQDLSNAGLSFRLPATGDSFGAFIFVAPSWANWVQAAMQQRGLTGARYIAVAPEFETRLWEALASIRAEERATVRRPSTVVLYPHHCGPEDGIIVWTPTAQRVGSQEVCIMRTFLEPRDASNSGTSLGRRSSNPF